MPLRPMPAGSIDDRSRTLLTRVLSSVYRLLRAAPSALAGVVRNRADGLLTAVATGADRGPLLRGRSRRLISSFAASLALLTAVPFGAGSPAYAGMKVDSFFPLDGTRGSLGGQFSAPRDIAINDPAIIDGNGVDGWIYVVDDVNHRIQVFNSAKAFQFAMGRNVSLSDVAGDGGGVAEKCTTASDCQAGVAGALGAMFSNPQGVDIDQSTGHFYVRDRGNRRIQEFEADGDFVKAWGGDVDIAAGTGFEVCATAANCKAGTTTAALADDAGSFGTSTTVSTAIAVSPVNGHVFAGDPQNRRMMEFAPGAATPAGVFVRAWGWNVDPTGGSGQFETCTAATTCQAGVLDASVANGPNGVFGSLQPAQVAVDSRGMVYASDRVSVPGSLRVVRFDSTKTLAADVLLAPVVSGLQVSAALGISALEVDPDSDGAGAGDFDRLYVGYRTDTVGITEYDVTQSPPALTPESPHMPGSGLGIQGLAPNPSAGELLVSAGVNAGDPHRIYVLDGDGAEDPPDVALNQPSAVTGHEAMLSGTANPAGFPSTYRFEYSKDGTVWTAVAADQSLGSGTAPVAIDDALAGLEANTIYRIRLAVTRGFGNGTVLSAPILFETDAIAPEVTTFTPNQRSAQGATLAGQVNPNGSPTTYRFEYGSTTSYGSSAPVPAASAGSGGVTLPVNQVIGGLEPGTTYHYRLVAENAEGVTAGADQAFTTRADVSQPPDDRSYELVSPSDKIGGIGVGSYAPGDFAAAGNGFPSNDGERYAVSAAWGPTLLDGAFAYANDWAFADRRSDSAGWVSHSPFSRPNAGYAGNRFAMVTGVNDDLSLLAWGTNGAFISFFAGLRDVLTQVGADQLGGSGLSGVSAVQVGDWTGRYEALAPTRPAQGTPGDGSAVSSGVGNAFPAANGSHVLFSSQQPNTGAGAKWIGGLPDDGDPFLDRVGGRAVYVVDLAGGPSDTYPGTHSPEAVGVCDAGSRIPAREETTPGVFKQAEQPCAPTLPGRAGALVSSRGVTLTSTVSAYGSSQRNLIAADGSRVFFMAPDANAGGVPAGGPDAPSQCSGTGVATLCPQQLYVRQELADGTTAVRWVSRSAVPGQDASLMAITLYEGATADGDKVYFRTNAPLTPDDPNAACGAPCTAGAPSATSWDLFEYDFTDDPGDDPGAGQLTRISAGPGATGNGNVQPGGKGAALRFASADGSRIYFTSASPLPNVPPVSNGTITEPSGTPTSAATTNLYVYDRTRPLSQRVRFIALLPRSDNQNDLAACATTGFASGDGFEVNASLNAIESGNANCVDGATDGSFITFMTNGRLVGSDPDASSGDIYGYDAVGDELSRLSAPQGGAGETYPCLWRAELETGVLRSVQARCHGDAGIGQGSIKPRLGVVTEPAMPGDRSAYFQSKSRLVPEDTDDEYDVYQWRNGNLSLLTPDTSTGAYYLGNSTDGQDVFVMTRDRLSWQDVDSVMDVYDARIDGGIPEPLAPPASCLVLGDGCQGATATATGFVDDSARGPAGVDEGDGPTPRARFSPRGLTGSERASLAIGGTVRMLVDVNVPGKVAVRGRAKAGRKMLTVLSSARSARRAGVVTVPLNLAGAARKALQRDGRLHVRVAVTFSMAPQPATLSFTLRWRRPAPAERTPSIGRGGRS